MSFLSASLEVIGPFEKIRAIDQQLSVPFIEPPREINFEDSSLHRAVLMLIDEELEEPDGVDQVLHWIRAHIDSLRDVNGRKVLEIESVLEPHEGSRFLTISVELLRLLADADIWLRHQFLQRPSSGMYLPIPPANSAE